MMMQSGPPRMMMGAPGARHLNPRFSCFLQGAGLCVCLFVSLNCRRQRSGEGYVFSAVCLAPRGLSLPHSHLVQGLGLSQPLVYLNLLNFDLYGDHYHHPPTIFKLVTVRTNSCGKVMFSQASVILFTGVSAPVHAGIHPTPTVTAADDTHPTGMLSCSLCSPYCRKGRGWHSTRILVHLFYHKLRKRSRVLGATLRGPGFDR